jgi:AcrR family transcriptional regulator
VDITNEAGISRQAIDYHFRSKREILLGLYQEYGRIRKSIMPYFEKVAKMAETEDPIQVLMKTDYHFAPSIRGTMYQILAIAAATISTNEDSARFINDNVLAAPYEQTAPVIRKLIGLGRIEPMDVDQFIDIYKYYCFSAAALVATPFRLDIARWKRGLAYLYESCIKLKEKSAWGEAADKRGDKYTSLAEQVYKLSSGSQEAARQIIEQLARAEGVYQGPAPAAEMFEYSGHPTKKRIYRAAASVFAEQGYDSASLLTITNKMGMKRQAIDYHFRSKKEILQGLYQEYGRIRKSIMPYFEKVAKMAETEDPIQVLLKTDYHFDLSIRGTMYQILAIAAGTVSTNGDSARFIEDNVLAAPYEQTAPIIRKLIELGRIEPINVDDFIDIYKYYCFSAVALVDTPFHLDIERWKRGLAYLYESCIKPRVKSGQVERRDSRYTSLVEQVYRLSIDSQEAVRHMIHQFARAEGVFQGQAPAAPAARGGIKAAQTEERLEYLYRMYIKRG